MFIRIKDEAKIILESETVIAGENEIYLADGKIPHSVWNNAEEEAVLICISAISFFWISVDKNQIALTKVAT